MRNVPYRLWYWTFGARLVAALGCVGPLRAGALREKVHCWEWAFSVYSLTYFLLPSRLTLAFEDLSSLCFLSLPPWTLTLGNQL